MCECEVPHSINGVQCLPVFPVFELLSNGSTPTTQNSPLALFPPFLWHQTAE